MYGALVADAESGKERGMFGNAVDESKRIIGTWGSLALFMNAIVGPGITSLPKMYQQSGWAFPTFALVVGGAFGALATIVSHRVFF